MYLPTHFEPPDRAAMLQLMQAHPLATLVSNGPQGLGADHMPLICDATDGADGSEGGNGSPGCLRGHVARANPLWRDAAGTEVLVVFQGAQAYISPSWYATKAATGKVVPTWNYMVVHARGVLRPIEDAAWLHAFVSRLTDTHEAPRAQPWAVADAPDDYVTQMLRAIVGIEIELTALQGKWKLSQNRHQADRRGVADGLAGNGDEQGAEMAAWLRARL
jgi:transcriptional regulator